MRSKIVVEVVAILLCLTMAGAARGQFRPPGVPGIPQPPQVPQPGIPQPGIPQFTPPGVPQPNLPHMVVVKRCMRCGHEVPAGSMNGMRCPYCGVVWGSPSDLIGDDPATSTAGGETTVELCCGHCGKSVSQSSDFGESCPHCGVNWVAKTRDTLIVKTTVVRHGGSSSSTSVTSEQLTAKTRKKLNAAAIRLPSLQTVAMWLYVVGGLTVLAGLAVCGWAWQKKRIGSKRLTPLFATVEYEPPPALPATAQPLSPPPVIAQPATARPATGAGKAQWMYRVDGQELGPVTSAQLKQLAATGRLSPGDKVWREGMPKWVPASMVKGLFTATT